VLETQAVIELDLAILDRSSQLITQALRRRHDGPSGQ
jgi:hypothetical protein